MQNNDFKIDINATGLDLSQRELGDAGAAALADALLDAKNLRSLNLEYNNIGVVGAVALAGVLPRTNLTTLNLSSNNISDAGAAALADVLPSTNLTSLDLGSNNIGDAGAAAILEAAQNNPLFLTRIEELSNSDAINAVVDANRQLKMTAKVGVCSLVKNHRFPVPVAVMIAGYVNGEDITDEDIKSIREDKEVEALLAPAASGSFAQPQDSLAEVASGDDDQKRADYMSRGLSCVIV